MSVLLARFMDRAPLSLADINEFIEENGVFSVLTDTLFYRNKDQKIVYIQIRLTMLIECLMLLFQTLLSSLMKLDFFNILPGVQSRLCRGHPHLMPLEISVLKEEIEVIE